MIEYMKELANTILSMHAGKRPAVVAENIAMYELLAALRDELYRLDPRDFEPNVRHNFIVGRVAMKHQAEDPQHRNEFIPGVVNPILPLLDQYRGEGSRAVTRNFDFMTNKDVQKIVERDYTELTLRAFPDGAWKSSVVLAGSILEAVLYDRLTKDPAAIAAAIGATSAPKKKRGGPTKDIQKHDRANQWTLSDLIKVASELGILPPENEIAIDQVLREYRNYVHPRVEVEKGVPITEGHATASKGMLDVILDELK